MFDAGKLCELPGLLDGSRFNGAIIANTVAEDDAFLAENELMTPVVLIGRNIPKHSSVREIPERTGQEAAEILLKADGKNLAVLHACKRLLTQTTNGRLRGFVERAKLLGLSVPAEITSEGSEERHGYLAMKRFLKRGEKINGLYSIRDNLAVGAYRAIKESGLRIPEDIAVIGTGDYPGAPYLDPPLSTFTRSQYSLHEEAVKLLLGHLTGEIKTPTHILIPVIPVLRKSTQRGQLATSQ